MKKYWYVLLLLVEALLMAGKTPASSPLAGAQNKPFDFDATRLAALQAIEAESKDHASAMEQEHDILNPQNTPLAPGTPPAPYHRVLGLVRSKSDPCLAHYTAGEFIYVFGYGRSRILANVMHKREMKQESKAE